MTISNIDEAIKEASTPNKSQVKSSQSSQQTVEKASIIDERMDFKSIGFQDGLWMSADYQEGFAQGLAEGISEARFRTLNALNKSLKANREKKIPLKNDSIPFEIYSLPGLSIFQLPSGDK